MVRTSYAMLLVGFWLFTAGMTGTLVGRTFQNVVDLVERDVSKAVSALGGLVPANGEFQSVCQIEARGPIQARTSLVTVKLEVGGLARVRSAVCHPSRTVAPQCQQVIHDLAYRHFALCAGTEVPAAGEAGVFT